MNRRSVLKWLAAVPLVGPMLPKQAAATVSVTPAAGAGGVRTLASGDWMGRTICFWCKPKGSGWQHIAVTRDGEEWRFSIDGEEVCEDDVPVHVSISDHVDGLNVIGTRRDDADLRDVQMFDGKLDTIQIEKVRNMGECGVEPDWRWSLQ